MSITRVLLVRERFRSVRFIVDTYTCHAVATMYVLIEREVSQQRLGPSGLLLHSTATTTSTEHSPLDLFYFYFATTLRVYILAWKEGREVY